MLRNPVDMVYSLHNQFVISSIEPIADFEEMVSLEFAAARMPRHERDGFRRILPYLEIAKYFEQVSRYLRLFPSSKIHFIYFEELQDNAIRIYKGCQRFLDLPLEPAPLLRPVNQAKTVRWRPLQRIIYARPRLLIAPFRSLFPDWFRHRLRIALESLNIRSSPRPQLDEPIRRQLTDYFRDDIVSLGSVLNKDLSSWL